MNRFPVCAAFYYVIAKRLGYKEDEAKSLGLARAIFFAAAKTGFKKGTGKVTGYVSSDKKTTKSNIVPKQIMFAGLYTTVVEKNGELRAVVGKVIDPKQFDRSVIKSKFNLISPKSFDYFCAKVNDLISDYTNEELNNSKLAYSLYQRIRDEYRSDEFYKEVK